MSNPIKGKVVVIIGASSEMGESTARLLAAQGAHLVIGADCEDRLQTLARELANGEGKVIAMHAATGRHDQVQHLVDAAVRTFGRMDIMVSASVA